MLGGASFGRALAEATLLVVILVPIHIALEETTGLTVASAVTILLAFFLPPLWGAFRLGPPRGGSPSRRVLRVAVFGPALGLLAGGLGGLEKLAGVALVGETLPVSLLLWLTVAAFFAMASATAYALIVLGVLALVAIHQDPGVVRRYLFPDLPGPGGPAGASATARALAYSLVPGLGHYYLGRSEHGAAYLVLTLELALAALCALIAGLILMWEARASLQPFLILVAGLLLSPFLLVLLSVLDVAVLRLRASATRTV